MVDTARLQNLVAEMAGRTVVVLGDPVLDVYVHGTTLRISREAPVPIVREDGRELRLGGAANTAWNLAALGARTQLAGLIGADDEGRALDKHAQDAGVDTGLLTLAEDQTTVTKTRVLAGALHTTKQQMLRVDRENTRVPAQSDRQALSGGVKNALRSADALLVSDYGSGALTEDYAAMAREHHAQGGVVVVDSRYALTSYQQITAATPNAPEAEAAMGMAVDTDERAVAAAEALRSNIQADALILTRGREGMAVAESAGQHLIRPHGQANAVDVTGAGDTVIATLTLALCAGASMLEAAVLANCAASITVQHVGTAVCTTDDLRSSLLRLTPNEIQSL